MNAADQWTIQRVLLWSTGFLEERRSETPRLDAELLLSHALGCSRIQLYTNYDKPLLADEREPFKAYLKRRAAGEPVAYITGSKEFMGLMFAVTPAVLIPRPDTETLVEVALVQAKQHDDISSLSILDVGTGSGCVAVALAKRLPKAALTAWDVSDEALAVANANAARHSVAERIQFAQVDALRRTAWEEESADTPFDLIVSNPPYIAPCERPMLSSSVAAYEPACALFADEGGLTFYRVFADSARRRLRAGGQIIVEIGCSQAEAVAALFEAAGWQQVTVFKDYGKLDRVISARA